MSYESNPYPFKVADQPTMSQLSVEAACFIPTNFEQPIASTADEVPPYFDGFVWQGTEMKNASPYLRSLGQWPLGHPYGAPAIPPPPFHYGQYPPPVDYWPTSRISPVGRPPDTFNSPYSDFSWNSWPSQEASVATGVSVRRPKSNRANDPIHAHPGPVNSGPVNSGPVNAVAGSKDCNISAAALPSECEEPVRTKKRKKKSRSSIIRMEPSGEASQGVGAQAKDAGRGKSAEEEDISKRGTASLFPSDSRSPREGSAVYKDSDAQTDFSEELSRSTLSEKPSSLYDQSTSPDFFTSYGFTGNSPPTALGSSGTVPSKPLLWATIVSRTAAHPVRKTDIPETTTVPFDLGFKSRSDRGVDSANKKGEKKFGFDHSSMRSQSGKRKSTGISTNDQKRDQGYPSGKGKHEYSSGKYEYSVTKQKESSEKPVTAGKSSLTETKREVLADGRRIQSAAERSSKSQRAVRNGNDDFPLIKTRGQKQMPIETGAGVFRIRREEENKTSSANRHEERNVRDAESRSPSWRRSQTIGASSWSKTIEPCQPSRSASGGQRVAGGTSSTRIKVEKYKCEETRSLKTSVPEVSTSRHGITTSGVKPEAKTEGGVKRRRKNRKKKTDANKEDGEMGEKAPAAENGTSSLSPVGPSILMQFDDDDEFPGLLYAAQVSLNEVSSGPIKYSDVLSGRAKTPSHNYISNRPKTSVKGNKPEVEEDDISDWDLDMSSSKQKESLYETPPLKMTTGTRSISQPPKSTPKPTQEKRAVGAGAKTKEPITLSLFDMITTVKTKGKKAPEKEEEKKPLKTGARSNKESKSGNVLDSSGVHMRRGKEREVPKAKKPSLLRKVILKERESRRQKFLRDCTGNNGKEEEEETDLTEDGCDDGLRRHASAPVRTSVPRVASVSPSSARDVPSPQDEQTPPSEAKDPHKEMLQSMIHSRRFREYCTQVLSKEINDCSVSLLQELVRFQDRLYHKDPNKARLKRRIVLGLREVTKHLKSRRIKCVIISPNLERIQSKGGLDEALHNIIAMCQFQNIPFIFALSRKQLGKACCKVVPVSVVGIFSYEGAEEHFKKLKDLTEKARDSYEGMVSNLASELEELCKLYPVENWPADGKIGYEDTIEDTLTPSPCKIYDDGKTCPPSRWRTLSGAEGQFSPIELANLKQQSTHGNDIYYTNPNDSTHESHVIDELTTETGSGQSLEAGQVMENGGLAEATSNGVSDTPCPSGVEFIPANALSS